MADFVVDARVGNRKNLKSVAESLRFDEGTRTFVIDAAFVGVVTTYTGDSRLWAPFEADDGTVVALAGVALFDESEWSAAVAVAGRGGLACAAMYRRYRDQGEAGLERMNGNGVLLVLDKRQEVLHLVADCSGVFPAFECRTSKGLLFGSHPDILADLADERHRFDETSMAEFLLSGRVTPPFTYYERIRALDHGTRLVIPLTADGANVPRRHHYFRFSYRGSPNVTENELAEELAAGFRGSIRRRTNPRLGTCALALSGGLDSRLLLACVEKPADLFAFTCHDAPNLESDIAASIARALDWRHVMIRREIDYYAENAERGVRISGGMGSFANNHFLGAMERLRVEGMQNLITGCYCDYLFKALPLNRTQGRFLGDESLAPFNHQFYFGIRRSDTPLATLARERWESRIPDNLRGQKCEEDVFQIEALRTFPLCYEGDNQQRVVPQRVTRWPLPVADREILDLYCRIPYTYKLNRSLFKKSLIALHERRIAHIPDANTGVRPGASRAAERLRSTQMRLRRRFDIFRRSSKSDGSWPNWDYLVAHSATIDSLWSRPNSSAMDFFRRVLGPDVVYANTEDYSGSRLFQFLPMLTLKLWLDQQQ